MTQTVERRYALSKIQAGDYLLPSNDGQALYRLVYEDDPTWETGHAWTVFECRVRGALPDLIDPDDWSEWSCVAQGLRTRAAAITEALRR